MKMKSNKAKKVFVLARYASLEFRVAVVVIVLLFLFFRLTCRVERHGRSQNRLASVRNVENCFELIFSIGSSDAEISN